MEVIAAALCFMFATVGMVFIVRLTQIESGKDKKPKDDLYEAYMKGVMDANEGKVTIDKK